MKNHAPIILNCFSRGGSNILWNIFLSHPEVCSPIKETLELFRINPRKNPKWAGYKLALLSAQPLFFNQWHLRPRKDISAKTRQYIDQILFDNKLNTLQDSEMKFKAEDQLYSRDEVEKSRIVLKNNNGLTYLSDAFLSMYPDATFFSLVRNPVALYESHKRRGLAKNVEQFSRFYNTLCQRMLDDAARLPNYHILKFETMIGNPKEVIPDLYTKAGLDIDQVPQFRFKAKRFVHSDGEHRTKFEMSKHYWFGIDNLYEILEPKVNDYQNQLLSEAEIEQVMKQTAAITEKLGYQ
ncbi:MAG: hypothetical protein Roseis2KO_05610 [Roseivirga sp.]